MPETSQTKEVRPFKGEIVDYPGTGIILVLIGYHKLEVDWGRLLKDQFEENIQDPGKKVTFYELTDPRRADTGEDSRVANYEITRKLNELGNVEMIVDLHEHPGAQAIKVHNSLSLTTENNDVISEAKVKINELRTYPFDDYSRRRTGERNIPYALTDPDLPKNGLKEYKEGIISPEMQQALNDSMFFLVNLANIQLTVSAKK